MMIRGVALLAVLSLSFLAAPLAAEAQQAGRIARVGWLFLGPKEVSLPSEKFLRDALRDAGWVEGKNLVIEAVHAESKAERLPGLVAELLNRRVDVIVTAGTTAIRAAKDATTSVPIVMAGGGDPVATRLVQSLSRPGGNVTGVSLLGREMSEKKLDLLRQAVPRLKRIALIRAAANPANQFFFDEINAAAKKIGISVVAVDIRQPGDFDAAFERMDSDAVVLLLDPMFVRVRQHIADLAILHRLPLMSSDRAYAEAGALITYGSPWLEILRATVPYIDKILRGAKPGDLPIEQPRKSDLVINLKTAKALGLTIPPSLLLRADQVLE
jgi:putative ABC transport system substrate-binding protein